VVAAALRTLAESVERSCRDVKAPALPALRRRKSKRTAARALVASASGLVIVGLSIMIALTASSPAPPPTLVPPSNPVLAVSPSINLDIVTAQAQVSVNLARGSIRTSPALVSPGAPGAGVTIALARSGYILGVDGSGYIAVSDNLQKVLHQWVGQYAAPASDPADVWLSQPYADPSRAQEFNKNERAVGVPAAIPQGSIVDGQVGQNLVLQTAPPAQSLELWNPSDRTLVAALGGWDQEATSASSLAWSSGNVLHIVDGSGVTQRTVVGPVGDWAVALTFSPDGSKIAVVWTPRPGSPSARSRSAISARSTLSVVSVATGAVVPVAGSAGASGPVAWTENGNRLFFGQEATNGNSAGVSTYLVGASRSAKLKIAGVRLPADFGPSTGSLIVWNN
jgi:hypothetical protein